VFASVFVYSIFTVNEKMAKRQNIVSYTFYERTLGSINIVRTEY
jgi:hypothetical protein